MKTNTYAGIHPHIVAVIAREARKLVGRHGFTAADVADVEQDLHRKVWIALKGLDEALFEAAVNQIVKHEVIDMIRGRERECRDWRRVSFSLNTDSVGGDDGDNEHDERRIDLAEDLLVVLGYAPSWQSRRWQDVDLDWGLKQLPDDLRDLAETLDACEGNLSEAARLMGVTRKKARILLARLQQAMDWLRDE